MNSLHPLRLAALALAGPLGLAASMPVLAQADSYSYFGLSAGQARHRLDEESLAVRALSPGVTPTIENRDERAKAYKLFYGWQWNRYLGAEAGYFDLGRSSFNASTVPTGTLDATMRIRGYNLDLVGTLPMGDTFALLGRAGVAFARTRGSFVGTGGATVVSPSPTDRQNNWKAGLGVQVAFSPSVLMRAEAERYRVSDGLGQRGRINTYTVSLLFPFGRAPAAAPRAEAPMYQPTAYTPAPAPVAVAVLPPPVVAPAPMEPERVMPRAMPAPTPARVVLPVDSMFSHDSRELRPEAKAALDSFASRISGRRYTSIVVVGHADRMGEDPHNQALSQQRADVVKAYLGTLSGVDPGRVEASGRGSSEPVTAMGDCGNSLARDALIVCLQRDRRVEVDVTGEP